MTFKGKVIWITGASSGIGEALVKALGDTGADIILSARRDDELRRVAEQTNARTMIVPFDMTAFGSMPDKVRQAWNWAGGIDLLINNAGVSQRSLAIDTPLDTYRRLMDVNFFGPLRLTQLVLARMINRGTGGHIAAVSSVSGKVGSPLLSGYAASKHALIGYFDALRAEVERAYDVKVSVVVSGFVRTALAKNALTVKGATNETFPYDMEHAFEAEKAASTILEGLAAAKREIVFACGRELRGLTRRANDAESAFDALAEMGAQLAEQRELRMQSLP